MVFEYQRWEHSVSNGTHLHEHTFVKSGYNLLSFSWFNIGNQDWTRVSGSSVNTSAKKIEYWVNSSYNGTLEVVSFSGTAIFSKA